MKLILNILVSLSEMYFHFRISNEEDVTEKIDLSR